LHCPFGNRRSAASVRPISTGDNPFLESTLLLVLLLAVWHQTSISFANAHYTCVNSIMKMLLLSVLFFTLYVSSHANGYFKTQPHPEVSSESAQGFILWKELLSFVVNQSTGKQLHIVYDDSFRDISFSPHLKELFSSDIVIYDIGLNEDDDVHSSNNQTVEHNNINQFLNVLIDSKYTLDMKNVIIICNIQTVIEIFKEVRQHSLESPNIQWFLVLQNDNVGDLLSYLREGTQISLAKKVDNAK
ncbi:unnamed protein product, partial [Meganyctiphanes norvegica]